MHPFVIKRRTLRGFGILLRPFIIFDDADVFTLFAFHERFNKKVLRMDLVVLTLL